MKACIIVHLLKTDEFPERRFSEQCWTHNLLQLLGLAGLKTLHEADIAADPVFSTHWGVVKDWSETSRYARKTKTKAQVLYKAITDKKHGVFRWIKSHW